MKPYFDASHLAAVLMLIVTMAWGAMEAGHAGHRREGAVRAGGGGQRFAVIPAVLAASAMLWLAPRLVPAAAIRPGAAAFTAGLVILVASANWAGLAAIVVLPLAAVLWRIHAEETALLGTLGDRYRVYAAQHKRLVPLIW